MDTQLRVLILIPSRYQSSRFPGKPLSLIKSRNSQGQSVSRTLAHQVFLNCSQTQFSTHVVTDHDEIEKSLKDSGANVIRVDDDVPSGTERICLAYQRNFESQFDYIINVQGDEPLLKAQELIDLVHFHNKSDFDITTLVRPRNDKGEISNPNIVKTAMSGNGRCLYFSRSAIPFDRKPRHEWFQHIGVYCYKPSSLTRFVELQESSLEKIECLEQLRALEAGMSIGAIKTKSILMGVDTPEDLEKVNAHLLGTTETTGKES